MEAVKGHIGEILVIVKASIVASFVWFFDNILAFVFGASFINPMVKDFCDETAPIIKWLTLLAILILTVVRLGRERAKAKKKQDNRPFDKDKKL